MGMARGLQVYGRVGEGRGKCVPKASQKASRKRLVRQRKREAEEADMVHLHVDVDVEIEPGMAVGSLRHYRATLIGPTQERPPEAASAAPVRKHEKPESTML